MMELPCLVQVGINNVIIAKANGREMSVYELRLLDQFAKTAYAEQRLKELCINVELEQYDENGRYIGDDTPEDSDTTGGGDGSPVT